MRSINGTKAALLAATSLGLLCSTPVLAQDQAAPSQPAQGKAADDKQAKKSDSEIVVTGTSIRGIAPVGNTVISLGAQKIEESGATSGGELLSKIPQLASFGTMPVGVTVVSGSNTSNPINRPNLRNLPGAASSGGAATLVLIDGHRVVGAGTQQVGVDADVIAPSAVQRVEALTDGGSAVYGSDALGGVINFITRKRFNGLELNARVGIGNDITTWDGSVTAGKDWGTGGLYATYNYAHHDELYGRDRGYVQRINFTTGIPVGRFCANPNITASPGGVSTSLVVSGAGLAAGGPNSCDQTDDATFYPRMTTQNVFARLNQDLSDWLTFDATVMWAHRDTLGNGGTLGSDIYSSAVTTSVVFVPVGRTGGTPNALYRPVPGDLTGVIPETIQFNLAPAFGLSSAPQHTIFDTWEISPSFTFKLGGDWQLRTLMSYGNSKVSYANLVISPAGLAAGLANGGGLNPFNVAASTPAALSALTGMNTGYGRNELFDYRAIVDGPLVHLPGGELRVAVGAEYLLDNFQAESSSATTLALLPISNYSQNVKSVFGEATLPIFGTDNGFWGMRQLTVSASARYDSYNDFGSTFNPKVGVTWKPVDWWTLRGNWGTSFNAPSPVDQLGVRTAQASNLGPASTVLKPLPCTLNAPGCAQTGDAGVILLNGAAANLKPQTAKAWSVGTTIEPPFIPGLQINFSYYMIDIKSTLGRPAGPDLTPFYANFPSLYIIRPTGTQLTSFISDILPANQGFVICNPTDAVNVARIATNAGGCGAATAVGAVADTRSRNLGASTLAGLDFSVFYKHATGFGSIDGSFAGNYQFQTRSQVVPTAPVTYALNTGLHFRTSLGADIGERFRIEGTWNYSAGYDNAVGSVPLTFGQTGVSAFNTFDLFLKYDVKGSGIGKDLAFTLNVVNLLDQDPPVLKTNSATQWGYDQQVAFTLGRVIQIGVHKKF